MAVKGKNNNSEKVVIGSRIATLVVLLALVRCIGEVFRLEHLAGNTITYTAIKPFIIGAMICAVSVSIITVLSFFRRHTAIIVMAIVNVAALLLVKAVYM